MEKTILDTLRNALNSAKRVLVVSHINPDGDAVGSAAAVAHIARRMQSDVRILLASGVPDFLSWLPLPAPLVRRLDDLGEWQPDLLFFVDCGDMGRAGPDFTPLAEDKERLRQKFGNALFVNIDHHVSNPGYAEINWVEPERSATGELVGELAEHCGFPLDGELGEALYLALVSDTGNFTFSNTSAVCFAMAARIVDAGLDIGAFTDAYEHNWSIARMHLWGRLMSEISLYADGAIACSIVPKQYLDELGLKKEALEGYASWLRKLRGVRVGLFIREDSPGVCKISLRSMGDVNVQTIAALYGGGGHAAASGAELRLPPDAVARQVIADIVIRL